MVDRGVGHACMGTGHAAGSIQFTQEQRARPEWQALTLQHYDGRNDLSNEKLLFVMKADFVMSS